MSHIENKPELMAALQEILDLYTSEDDNLIILAAAIPKDIEKSAMVSYADCSLDVLKAFFIELAATPGCVFEPVMAEMIQEFMKDYQPKPTLN